MPVLSGFLPIPLAMMIPFMGAQSLVLGKQFGEGFQYGKRKISAMTNQQFNKITPQKIAQDNADELRQMIPSMKQSIQDMRDFQTFIVRELIETAKQLPNDIFGPGAGFDVGKATDTAVEEGFGLNLLPKAFAETSNETKKFASDYELEAMALPIKLLSDIVQKMLSGKLLKPIERKIGYLNAYKKRLPEKSTKTTETAIIESGATGMVKFVSINISNMKIYLSNLRKHAAGPKGKSHFQYKNNLKIFIRVAKAYNKKVLGNSKYGRKFRVDTAQSIKNTKLTFG